MQTKPAGQSSAVLRSQPKEQENNRMERKENIRVQ